MKKIAAILGRAVPALAVALAIAAAPSAAWAAGCDVAPLTRAIGKITEPAAAMSSAAAAAHLAPKAVELEGLSAKARAGASDDPDPSRQIVCAKLVVDANLALAFVETKRRAAIRAIADASSFGDDLCQANPTARAANASQCEVLLRQRKLAPARAAAQDLVELTPVVAKPPREMSPETWSQVGKIMHSLQRTVREDWPTLADDGGRNRLAVICSVVSVASKRRITSWKPVNTPSENDRGDAFDRPYDETLGQVATQLSLPTVAGSCTDPASRSCIVARRVAVEASCGGK